MSVPHVSSNQTKSNVQPPQPSKLESKMQPRRVTRTLKVHEASECIGSKVRRCIGNRTVRCLPPFVICEHFKIDEMGRPPHPARGAQKITYMLSGRAKIEYSQSNCLELGPGDVTSLMVGKGVIRSVKAMESEEDENENENDSRSIDRSIDTSEIGNGAGKMHGKAQASGIQIYMDVPEPFKRSNPSHLNLCHSDIASYEPCPGAKIKILTGKAFGKKADQMLTATPALILDCMLDPGVHFELPIKVNWNAFAYVIKGQVHIQGEKAQKHQYVEFMRTSKSTKRSGHTGQFTGGSQQQSHTTDQKPKRDTQNNQNNYENDQRDHNDVDEEESSFVSFSIDKAAKGGARIFFCAAEPLCQPIYRQGPFIDVSMNWIYQAFDDYSERKNGFESGQLWNNHSRPSGALPTDILLPDSSKDMPVKGQEDSTPKQQIYNPCDDDDCSEANCSECEAKQDSPLACKGKASYPNVFPPGKVNPASYSSEFNDTDCIEEQQEQKLPQHSEEDEKKKNNKRKRRYNDGDEESKEREHDDSSPDKKYSKN